MAINLQKGQREGVQATKYTLGLGWNPQAGGTADFDLDASVFILGANGKLLSDSHFVFYNNMKSPDGSVAHSGDNRTGEGDGDDEQVMVDLRTIDPNAAEVCVVVTIHEGEARRQNFGQVRNSFIRVLGEAGDEQLRYDLDEDFSTETAVEFGRFYKRNDAWKFEAVGNGVKGGLEAFLAKYN